MERYGLARNRSHAQRTDGATPHPHGDVDKTQVLEESVDQLGEKRATTREAGLTTICNELRNNYNTEFVQNRKDTLSEAIKKGLKKGESQEQILSAQLLALICVTLGMDTEELVKECVPIFEEVLKNTTSDEVKCAVFESLAMGSFITSDEPSTIAHMKICSKYFETEPSTDIVKASALYAWALLLCSISKKYAYDTLLPDHLANITGLLKNDNVDLRVEAGEAIALLVEICRDIEGENFTLDNINGYIDTDELLDQLYELAQDKSKQRSRRERLKQKLPFKEIKDFVEQGQLIVEELEIKHQKLEFTSWSDIKTLDAFRDVLGTGFQVHFSENELVQDIFEVIIRSDAKKTTMSAIEKRMYMSPSSELSKKRTKSLNKQRSVREKATDSFLQEDQ